MTGASAALYRASYGHDQYQLLWEQELGLPWETPETWEAISPFNNVGSAQTPTLIMCGEKDWNVPVSQVDCFSSRRPDCLCCRRAAFAHVTSVVAART